MKPFNLERFKKKMNGNYSGFESGIGDKLDNYPSFEVKRDAGLFNKNE